MGAGTCHEMLDQAANVTEEYCACHWPLTQESVEDVATEGESKASIHFPYEGPSKPVLDNQLRVLEKGDRITVIRARGMSLPTPANPPCRDENFSGRLPVASRNGLQRFLATNAANAVQVPKPLPDRPSLLPCTSKKDSYPRLGA
jgi:hypothetical protein